MTRLMISTAAAFALSAAALFVGATTSPVYASHLRGLDLGSDVTPSNPPDVEPAVVAKTLWQKSNLPSDTGIVEFNSSKDTKPPAGDPPGHGRGAGGGVKD